LGLLWTLPALGLKANCRADTLPYLQSEEHAEELGPVPDQEGITDDGYLLLNKGLNGNGGHILTAGSDEDFWKKNWLGAGHWWLTPVIPATLEAAIRRITV
jgi:hypothetical protein